MADQEIDLKRLLFVLEVLACTSFQLVSQIFVQVAIIATSNTPLNIIIQYIYTIQTFSALHFALIRIYTQIFTALKLSLNENTKNIK